MIGEKGVHCAKKSWCGAAVDLTQIGCLLINCQPQSRSLPSIPLDSVDGSSIISARVQICHHQVINERSPTLVWVVEYLS